MTMPSAATPLPRRADVLRAEIGTVVMVLGPMLLLCLLPLFLVAAVGIILEPRSGNLQFETGSFLPLLLLAFALPLMVWWGQPFRSRVYHATLPVQRSFHDLSRALGGLLCVLAVVAAVLLGAYSIAAVAGGTMGVYWAGEDAVRTVPLWFWVTPFVGTAVAYTYGSALAVGTRHPVVWGIVSIYAPAILMEFAENVGTPGNRPLGWLHTWAHGPFGFVPALTGMSRAGNGPALHPVFSTWLIAALTWGALAAIALTLALRRHRDV